MPLLTIPRWIRQCDTEVHLRYSKKDSGLRLFVLGDDSGRTRARVQIVNMYANARWID